jgi:two-component system, sensor histidine kinase and response regulator
VASGVRMERMIDQLLDVARARLAGGIAVTVAEEHDLVSLTAKIVQEIQVLHPAIEIHFEIGAACLARVDADRVEQVLSNLLGNAVAHGDSTRPITVTVTGRPDATSVAVHNHGAPIDPALMPILFDPFKRGALSKGSSAGLGLGLYIAERIVTAHGGEILVDSSRDGGTRFEVLFPSGVGG